jgi:hypothetical protein
MDLEISILTQLLVIFIYMRNKFYNFLKNSFVAFSFGKVEKIDISKEEVKPEQETSSPTVQEEVVEKSQIRLNKEEIEFLLVKLQDITFKGSEVERVFTLTLKLQQMYLNS